QIHPRRTSACKMEAIDATRDRVPARGRAPDRNVDGVGIGRIDDQRAEEGGGENVAEQILPVGAAINRLEDASVRSVRRRVQDVRIARIKGQALAEDGEA